MAKQPNSTPVTGTCSRTGKLYSYPSFASVEHDGYCSKRVRDCVHGRAKTHGGLIWKAAGPLRPTNGNRRALQIAELYNAGMTYEEIGQKEGITLQMARRYVNAARSLHAITRNTIGGAK